MIYPLIFQLALQLSTSSAVSQVSPPIYLLLSNQYWLNLLLTYPSNWPCSRALPAVSTASVYVSWYSWRPYTHLPWNLPNCDTAWATTPIAPRIRRLWRSLDSPGGSASASWRRSGRPSGWRATCSVRGPCRAMSASGLSSGCWCRCRDLAWKKKQIKSVNRL